MYTPTPTIRCVGYLINIFYANETVFVPVCIGNAESLWRGLSCLKTFPSSLVRALSFFAHFVKLINLFITFCELFPLSAACTVLKGFGEQKCFG